MDTVCWSGQSKPVQIEKYSEISLYSKKQTSNSIIFFAADVEIWLLSFVLNHPLFPIKGRDLNIHLLKMQRMNFRIYSAGISCRI